MIRSTTQTACFATAMVGLTAVLGGCGTLGSACGGLGMAPCDPGLYCRYEEGVCDSGDASGTCEPIPEFCPELFAPACGCDGTTYDNDCFAAAAGVNIASHGACVGVGSGLNGDDDTGDSCGGIAGVVCSEGQYCQFDLGTCGAADQPGTCQNIPSICTEIFAPVCGCDGQTYSNDCLAAVEEISIQATGPCP